MRPHDFTYEKRRLNHWFEQQGIERVGRWIVTTGLAGRAQTEAWMRDSLLWSIEEFDAGHPLYAFRGYAQACGYAGELGGWGYEQDTRTALHNALEDVIRQEDHSKEVLQDCLEQRDIFRLAETGRALLRFIRGEGRNGYFRPDLEEAFGRALDRAEEWSR